MNLHLYLPKLFVAVLVDDTVFFTGENIHDLIDIVKNKLVNVMDWLNVNKIPLNIEKTHIIFCNRAKITGAVGDALMNGYKIWKDYDTKFFDIIIESNLMWKYYLDYICN